MKTKHSGRGSSSRIRSTSRRSPSSYNTNKGAAILVKNAVIRSANKRTLDMFGYQLKDMRGMPFEEFIAPEFRGTVINNYARMIAGQITRIHFKLEVLSKNGAQVPAEIYATVIETKKGPVVMAQIRGFSSKKRSARSIRQLFTSARCLIWNATVVRKNDKFVWNLTIANEDACRQFLPLKMSPEQSYKDAWRTSIHPNDRERMDFNSSSALLEGKTGYSQEFRCKNARAEMRWLSEDVHIRKAGVNKWRLIGVCMDVTDRKNTEEALRESEERYKKLVDLSPDAIAVHSEGKVVFVNKAAVKLLGACEYHDLVGKPVLSVVHQDSHEIVRSRIKGMYNDGKVMPLIEEKFVRLDGTLLNVEVAAMPLLYRGKPSIMVVLRDITERKQFEEKIRYLSFNDKLTGLYNRAFCEEEMTRLDTRRELPLSIIVGDVNNLKVTNDVFGHHEGDRLLVEVSKVLKDSCRKGDIVSRWGGDEFLMLLPRTECKVSEMIVERITEKCSQILGLSLKPSIALGTATKDSDPADLETVLKEAEGRMYCNKLFLGDSLHGNFVTTVEKAILEKGKESRRHIEQLRKYMLEFAQELRLPPEQVEALSMLAILHDIGKISIPEEVLLKPGPLTRDETNIMKKHSELGHRIAQTYHMAKNISDSILHHHERWDGAGYPRGLKGEQIPFNARVLAIVEAYDVMVNKQPYRAAMEREEALNEITKNAGTQFDPELVQVFLKVVSNA